MSLNIQHMTTQDKSRLLAEALGWRVVEDILFDAAWEEPETGRLFLNLPDFYETLHPDLPWRILNWAASDEFEHGAPFKDWYYGLDDNLHSPDWVSMTFEETVRTFLDKIVLLIVGEGEG